MWCDLLFRWAVQHSTISLIIFSTVVVLLTDASDLDDIRLQLLRQSVSEAQNVTMSVEFSDDSSNITTSSESVMTGHPFNWTINEPDLCRLRHPDLFVIAFVHTAPGNYRRRMLIRETWGSPRLYKVIRTVVLFAVGLPLTTDLQTAIEYESEKYHDIIQENFIDNYRNLTFKGQMWLKWAATYCPQATFILKTDDDISINIFNLVGHLNQLHQHSFAQEKMVFCLLWDSMPVMRDKASKWYISKEEFSEDNFGRYCSGSAFVLTNDMATLMFQKSLEINFFWVDDFYLTGLLPRAVNASYHQISSLYVLNNQFAEQYDRLINGYAIFGHVGSIRLRYYLWKEIVSARGYKSW